MNIDLNYFCLKNAQLIVPLLIDYHAEIIECITEQTPYTIPSIHVASQDYYGVQGTQKW